MAATSRGLPSRTTTQSSKATTVTTASVGATASLGTWEVSALLPYLDVGAAGENLSIDGVVLKLDESTGRVRGFGDAFVTAERALPLGEDFPVDVSVKGQLKLPTGRRIFSSGKVDGGVDVEVSRAFGGVSPFASLGYRVYGDTTDLEQENGWAASAGATFTYRRIVLIASYDWSQSSIGLPAGHEIFAVASGPISPRWTWSLYGSKGLSQGSADVMLGGGITRRFGVGPAKPIR